MGRTYGDNDAPRSLEQALRRLMAAEGKPDDSESSRLAEEFFGRPDALELLEEVIVEARLTRELAANRRSAPPMVRERRSASRSRELAIPSLHTSEGARGSGKTWRSWAIAAVALLAFGLGSSIIAIRLGRSGAGARGVPQYVAVSTGAAELDTLELPDGSRVVLAPNTSLRYSIAPSRGPRTVMLDGEAYFDIRHDDERPFRVQTRSATVADLGTSFVVREYAADASALVGVRSGAASVVATAPGKAAPETMHPGDGAYVDARGEIKRFTGDPESYGAWRGGKLSFDGAPLPEVLERLSRWYGVEFRMTDSTLARQYFTGSFEAVSLPQALEILGPLVHAGFEQQARLVVVTPRPGGR
jgi:ferric-dicitrate binding protein FerR (iron transport regulator)